MQKSLSLLFFVTLLFSTSCAALTCEQRGDAFVSSAKAVVAVADFAATAADERANAGQAQEVRVWLSGAMQAIQAARDLYVHNCKAATSDSATPPSPAPEVGAPEPRADGLNVLRRADPSHSCKQGPHAMASPPALERRTGELRSHDQHIPAMSGPPAAVALSRAAEVTAAG